MFRKEHFVKRMQVPEQKDPEGLSFLPLSEFSARSERHSLAGYLSTPAIKFELNSRENFLRR